MKDKDNIEKFFEERLSGKHFVFRESDWEKMEQKLEASPLRDKPAGAFNRKWFLIIPGLIIAFLLGWYGNKISESKVIQPELLKEGSSTNQIVQKRITSGEKPAAIKAEEEEVGQAEVNEKSVPLTMDPERTGSSTVFNEPAKATLSDKLTPHDGLNNNEPVLARKAALLSSPDFLERNSEITLPINKLQDVVALTKYQNEDSLTNDRLKQYALSIGLSYAPDLTSAGFMNQQQLAQSLGIQLYHHLGKNWILQTGINYVKKKYSAEPDNYLPYENYWQHKTYGYIPDDIYGYCSVIDIPLNITYKWSGSRKISFLTTAGISNYFLLDEEYFYEFNKYPNSSYGWTTTENSKFIGGIINASFGLSVKFNNRTNLQLEPYLKIPLKNIGYGNLKLFSAGSFFTVKYDIF